ncbi:MAG: LLM class flavin-dependent oxidoreductase [Thermomicrobiales bacterium]
MAEQLGYSCYFCLNFISHHRFGVHLLRRSAAATQRTTTIRLGAMAWTLPTKAPTQLAEDVAVLTGSPGAASRWVWSRQSDGGTGNPGINPADRIPMFQERAAVLQALWSGGHVTVNSDYTTIRSAALFPTPMQEPNPPLWFAGSDPDAATWVVGLASAWALGFKKLADLQPAADAFHKAVRARRTAKPSRVLPGEGRLALMRHPCCRVTRSLDRKWPTISTAQRSTTAAEPNSQLPTERKRSGPSMG